MRAVGGGGGAGGAGDYSGFPDDAAKGQADQVIELVQLRARLYVMADKVPVSEGAELRSIMAEIGSIDLSAPIYHWVVPRIKERLHRIMGNQIYKVVMEWGEDSTKLSLQQTILFNCGSTITNLSKMVMVQTHFSIMHSYSSKSALPFDHPVHDLAPRFIKTLADIAERLYVNMDFLCFTVQLPVTLQQMATNNSKGLLQAFEAASDFNQVINPAVSKDMDTLKELQMYHRMLQAEDYKALDYVVGPLQGHVWAVAKALYNLNDELKPLRLHA
ncbi:hypothetical protein D1007_22726 [Hordeum vulgare]|nr:hypothetical protein D1007_22726 [Hordeum vulgare]